MSTLIQVALATVTYFGWRWWRGRQPIAAYVAAILFTAFALVLNAIEHRWGWVGLDVLMLVLFARRLRDAWRNRKRRHALKRLGYKALALRAKLVDTMRRERQPRRVLRPSPSPA